jgi:hypothetical protein
MGRLICLVVLVWFLYWGLVDDVALYTTYSEGVAIFVGLADVVNLFCSVRLATVCRRCDEGGYSMEVVL